MANLSFQRDSERLGLYIPLGQTKDSPSLVVPFYKMERSELDDIVRLELSKQGITDEAYVQSVCDAAEEDYEKRRKVEEARKELRRLMGIRAQGGKLMSVGHKKWRQAFYPSGGK
ncbi:hypothetical protein LCGC14_0527320 [marine sediment metagenome]|uniref:Uncharacterized protein n=1 Tax=marine sediment metagenome TaxID=412755 RepID=A0A0F9UI05_9ZZZZ